MDDETGKFSSDAKLSFAHPYPPTKLMFIPDREGAHPDLLATTGDYLRIWHLTEDGTMLQKLLNNVSTECSWATLMSIDVISWHRLRCTAL